VLRGLYFPQMTPLTTSCPTGNCTWPSFQSLSMCHTCIDVTKDVTCRFTTDPSSAVDELTEDFPCDYMIKSTLIATTYITIDPTNDFTWDMNPMIIWPAGHVSNRAGNDEYVQDDADLNIPGWTSPMFAFYMLMLNTTKVVNGSSESSVIKAQKCALNFCIQQHSVSVVNSRFSQIRRLSRLLLPQLTLPKAKSI
jgi:hypothetical protein